MKVTANLTTLCGCKRTIETDEMSLYIKMPIPVASTSLDELTFVPRVFKIERQTSAFEAEYREVAVSA